MLKVYGKIKDDPQNNQVYWYKTQKETDTLLPLAGDHS